MPAARQRPRDPELMRLAGSTGLLPEPQQPSRATRSPIQTKQLPKLRVPALEQLPAVSRWQLAH